MQENENSIFENILQKLKSAEWGISVSVGAYLILIALGMLFSFCYYLPYKINIFKFSDINDFLLIPFADPFTIFFAVASATFVYSLYAVNEWWKKKYPVSFKKWTYWLSFGTVNTDDAGYKNYEYRTYLFGLFIYVLYSAMYYSDLKYKKITENQTYLEYKTNFEGDLPAKDSLTFLGDNANYYFLYHISKKEAYVIPKDKLNYLKIKKNPNGRFF